MPTANRTDKRVCTHTHRNSDTIAGRLATKLQVQLVRSHRRLDGALQSEAIRENEKKKNATI